jgi:hypothetical protein
MCRELHYRIAQNGEGWILYCNGPDLDNDGGNKVYKASNGLLSDGDIVLTSDQFHAIKR